MKRKCLIVAMIVLVASNSHEYSCDRTPKKAEPPKPNDNYIIEVAGNPSFYSPEKTYKVSLKSKPSSPITNYFYEFILVVEPNGSLELLQNVDAGQLITIDPTITKFTDKCRNAIVEWNRIVRKSSIEVMWKAPRTGSGCVAIKATVFESKESWFTDDGGLTKILCEEQENIDEQAPPLETCSACDEAKYEIAFQGMWTRNTHPRDYPRNMWETKIGELIGASHTNSTAFWNYESTASRGLALLAEEGNTSLIEEELKELVKNGFVRTIVKARELSYPNITGTSYTVVRVDKDHHLISLVAKMTPSPDWIVGVSNLELCTQEGTWTASRTLNLYPWDVGTDDGTSYNSTNLPASSPKPIQRITSEMEEYPFYSKEGEPLKPVAQLRVNRQKVYTKNCEDEKESCEYSEWNEWSTCSTTCGHEYRTRDRQITNPENAQECSEELEQNEKCDTDPNCEPTECANATWSAWTPCSVTCGEGSKTRQGQLASSENNEGESAPCQETVQCQMPECVNQETSTDETEMLTASSQVKFETRRPSEGSDIDCIVSEWSEWGSCSATKPCGRGYQFKERHILVNASNGGAPCPSKLFKKKHCRVPCLPKKDCILGPWLEWSPCTDNCGPSLQLRTRPILQDASNGGKPCGQRTQRRRCRLPFPCSDRKLSNMTG